MARSNTLPLQESPREKGKSVTRSTTSASLSKAPKISVARSTTASPPPSKHHISFPHPHIPHPHLLHSNDENKNSPNGALERTTKVGTGPDVPAKSKDKEKYPPASQTGRPNILNRTNSVQTRYMNMLLGLDTIPRFHNILASFFTWVLLAGFVIFPGTFTNLQKLQNNDAVAGNNAASTILSSVNNVPLLWIAGFCCAIGAAGMCWLWWRWRTNFVWLINRIFLPGCLNSLAGLISTLINVFGNQDGNWSVTAKVTVIVTGACAIATAVLFGFYNNIILKRVKSKHTKEMDAEGRVGGGEEEGLKEKLERKANEPALEPGSVV